MQNTTRPTVVALESINPEILFQVSGGCHKKKSCSSSASATAVAPAAAPVMQVLQLGLPQPQPAPIQQPLPQEPISRGPEVSTSVSINGQPA